MAAASTKTVSPGAFPELLRRSRFASFDPTIRQSYGTPPSHLHRGNWGLKRPIAQRKRNAFISLKNFEEHENYIEWNNAETQVRLIDKIEEINVAPKLVPQTPWFLGLGPAASSYWSKMDSEFAQGETGMPKPPESVKLFTAELEGLGLRGKGEYGMKPSTTAPATAPAPAPEEGYLHHNVHAMSPKVFKRYLQKLRSLRPEFEKFLKKNGAAISRETGLPSGNLHVRFLGQHFEKQFQDDRSENVKEKIDVHPNQSQSIRPQPHRLGGLMYASPTCLESFFSSDILPGIVLEDGSKTFYNSSSTATSHLVSTAGIIGRLDFKRAGVNVKPAFDNGSLTHPPATLLARQTGANTFIDVKVIDLQLERLPVAVTAFPSPNSSKDVAIRLELTAPSLNHDHSRTNTHALGTMLYNAPEDAQEMYTKDGFSNSPSGVYGGAYGRNRIMNRLRGHGDLANSLYGNRTNSDNSSILATLEKLRANKSSKAMVDLRWNRPKSDRWEDDQWVEPSNPNDDGESGDTGQGN